MDATTIGTIIAIIGLLAALAQAWIAWKEYRESKTLPVVNLSSEWRILRALINEDNGRKLEIYQASEFYKKAIQTLLNKNLIYSDEVGKFFLTPLGRQVVKKHLKKFINH
jgi:hypothetical protein